MQNKRKSMRGSRSVLLLLVLLLIGTYTFVVSLKDPTEGKGPMDTELLSISVYPTGTLSGTYMFLVKSDHTLEASVGDRRNDGSLQRVSEAAQKKLSVQELQDIVERIEKIQGSYRAEKQTVKDGWAVSIHYEASLMEMNYNGNDSEELKGLMDKLVQVSPIPVDLKSWS